MNQYLKVISNWIAINKLSLSIKKILYTAFCCHNDSVPNDLNIHINNIKLNRSNVAKYLVVIFDCNIRWNKHTTYITEKTRYLLQ